MHKKRIDLWKNKEYFYSEAFGFRPNLTAYMHEDNKVRPCMIVVPGGGYRIVSPTEGEIVAKRFFSIGYNTFVLTYTTNVLNNEPLKYQPMKDLSRAVREVRSKAEEYHIIPDKIVLCGFSAGAHLCASLCVHNEDIEDTCQDYRHISNKPDAAILAYPVITSGEKGHRGSFLALCGKNASKEELEYMSVEKHVTSDTPPCFLWQTADDEAVPVENSYLFAEACRQCKVPYAHHVFSYGIHGLSLADEIWAKGEYGNPYTLEQVKKVMQMIDEHAVDVNENMKNELSELVNFSRSNYQMNREAAVWPELAEIWLEITLGLNEAGNFKY